METFSAIIQQTNRCYYACLFVEEKDLIHWQMMFILYASACLYFNYLESNKSLDRKDAGHTPLSIYHSMTDGRRQKGLQALISH